MSGPFAAFIVDGNGDARGAPPIALGRDENGVRAQGIRRMLAMMPGPHDALCVQEREDLADVCDEAALQIDAFFAERFPAVEGRAA